MSVVETGDLVAGATGLAFADTPDHHPARGGFFDEAIGGWADQMEALAADTADLLRRPERCSALTRSTRPTPGAT